MNTRCNRRSWPRLPNKWAPLPSATTTSTTLGPTNVQSVSTFLSNLCEEGNQYTYEGNEFQKSISKPQAVQDSVNQVILNQECGKCPIEYSSQVSRAKIYDMKQLKC